jgi:hypothetical protein
VAEHDNDQLEVDRAIHELAATLRRIKRQIESMRLRLSNLMAAEEFVKSATPHGGTDSAGREADFGSRFSPKLEALGPYRPRS